MLISWAWVWIWNMGDSWKITWGLSDARRYLVEVWSRINF